MTFRMSNPNTDDSEPHTIQTSRIMRSHSKEARSNSAKLSIQEIRMLKKQSLPNNAESAQDR